MLKRITLIVLLLSISVFAQKINIAVAANVSYAIDDLIKEFNKINPDTKVLVTLGSSGKLTAQIKHGAPYDLFMAANMKYPESLYKDNIAITKPVIYAQGALAMLTIKDLDLSKGIMVTKSDKVDKIAIANPKTAPYGKAAVEAFKNANLELSDKFIYAESISQTVTYAITAADIGFIAKSSLYSSKMKKYKEYKNYIDVDTKLYTPIKQGIVILKKAKDSKEVKAFYDFILSENGKKILLDYGYVFK